MSEQKDGKLQQDVESVRDLLRSKLGVYPDWPKKSITFLDIFPIFQDPISTEALINTFIAHLFVSTIPKLEGKKIDVVVGLDARGFLFGPLIALRLGAGFVPVRKAGKLPGTVQQATYVKEYGEDTFEMQANAIKSDMNVIIVDDLIATGGSAFAAGQLVEGAGAKVVEYLFCIELTFLKGRDKLKSPTWSLIQDDD